MTRIHFLTGLALKDIFRQANERKQEISTINSKKKDCMFVSKRDSPLCELCIGKLIVGSTVTDKGRCNRKPKLHCNSERYLPETKQNIKRWENVFRSKEKSVEVLCNI